VGRIDGLRKRKGGSMGDWDPRENMGRIPYYFKFKSGGWVETNTIPDWVRNASDAPKKTNIPANGSVEATFTGDSLEYKIVTKPLPRGAGTYTEQEYYVRINDR
jgi:hypothetical protein